MNNKECTLEQISSYLDISPSDFKIAQERFRATKKWITEGTYLSGDMPDVYLQGSFRLGTVVRPYKNGSEQDFDIDQVCELTRPKINRSPKTLKKDIGDRLNEHSSYKEMLDKEGKRCWTLHYASEENRAGFHIDILPALPKDGRVGHDIDITDKNDNKYSWSPSNPKEYYLWFKQRNVFTSEFVQSQKRMLYESNKNTYANEADVPTQLVRSSLQRAIQIMKRHRDVFFSERDHKPISIIITTIAAHIHSDNSIEGIIQEFTNYIKARHTLFMTSENAQKDGILDYANKKWLILNPVQVKKGDGEIENFADKWNADPNLPAAFFLWNRQLSRDTKAFRASGSSTDLNLGVKEFGSTTSFSKVLQQNSISADMDSCINLLNFIHLGIDEKADWKDIESVAQSELDNGRYSKDIAKINFYQILKHKNGFLSERTIQDVKIILSNNSGSPAFIMCCNILLGSETKDMIKRCIALSFDTTLPPLDWPIVRLVDSQKLIP